ncbi:hypothetical protein [Saccharothrix variisporea]|uniref:Uncharacterized protein n=1 Tax=Saccharothrix variisporea TaxID=543527 RepID=A0A495XIC9_9PSEU|nr:hypothetical protein [Saccharothrix variisporea]RKT71358.1 hypothetical protein DFJ66_4647 [Saccharothrix variisporea]
MELMDEYLDALEPFLRDPEMREGQAYFNALGAVFWHLCDDVLGTDKDPHGVDRNLPAFLEWLEKALEREAVRRRWVRDGEMTAEFWAAVDGRNWRDHDVPGALRALAGGASDAYQRVVGSVAHDHSGTPYAVLAPALPFLLAVTTQVERARDVGLEVLLDVLSWVDWEGEPLDGAPHPDAVLRGLEGYWGYVKAMRTDTARELVWLMEEGPNPPKRVRPSKRS